MLSAADQLKVVLTGETRAWAKLLRWADFLMGSKQLRLGSFPSGKPDYMCLCGMMVNFAEYELKLRDAPGTWPRLHTAPQ